MTPFSRVGENYFRLSTKRKTTSRARIATQVGALESSARIEPGKTGSENLAARLNN